MAEERPIRSVAKTTTRRLPPPEGVVVHERQRDPNMLAIEQCHKTLIGVKRTITRLQRDGADPEKIEQHQHRMALLLDEIDTRLGQTSLAPPRA